MRTRERIRADVNRRSRFTARDWFRKALHITSPRDRVLNVDSEGVTLRDRLFEEELWQVRWREVEEIVAFKADLLTVDCICVGFIVTPSGAMWITDEETPGWDDLNRELASRFGVVFEKWFGEVAFPAFTTNETVLWRREATGTPALL